MSDRGATLVAGLLYLLLRAEEPERGLDPDVVALPVAAQGRQVVGGHGRERELGVFAGRVVGHALQVAFEVQQAVREHPGVVQHLANLGAHGAQVLGHYGGAVARTLKRDDTHQVLMGIAHVRAFGGRHAAGYPVEPEQPQGVVDAQRPGVPEALAYGLDEDLVSGAPQLFGRGRGERPVLARGVEGVGGRAGVRLAREHVGVAPGVAASGGRAHGEVRIQPHGHALGGRGRLGHLPVDEPLDVLVEQYLVLVLLAELRQRPALWRGVLAPFGGAAVVPPRLGQCHEGGEVVQREPLPLRVRPELLGLRGARGQLVELEPVVGDPERPELQGGHALVVHELRVPEAGALGAGLLRREELPAAAAFLEDGVQVEVDVVAVEPADGEVGADARHALVGDGVQRADAHEPRAQPFGGPPDEPPEVAQVADAPVALGAQRVQAQGYSPGGAFRSEALRRGDDEPHGAFGLQSGRAHPHVEAVVAGHQGGVRTDVGAHVAYPVEVMFLRYGDVLDDIDEGGPGLVGERVFQ